MRNLLLALSLGLSITSAQAAVFGQPESFGKEPITMAEVQKMHQEATAFGAPKFMLSESEKESQGAMYVKYWNQTYEQRLALSKELHKAECDVNPLVGY